MNVIYFWQIVYIWHKGIMLLIKKKKNNQSHLISGNQRDLLISILSLDAITLSSTIAKNLGIIFDQDFLFLSHIWQVSRTAFFHLHHQRSGVFCLRVMQKNLFKSLLLLHWTTATHYCQDVQIIPLITCSWSRKLNPEFWQESAKGIISNWF